MILSPSEIIRKKRDAEELSEEEIHFFISNFVKNNITDYQMAAFMMAVFFNPLTKKERAALTHAMVESGKKINLSSCNLPKVDKHSTGGIGDGVSISLAPLVGCCGVAVPMMSGRGLGHTGGTLDKLESIPGFRVKFKPSEIPELIKKTQVVMFGQTEEIVPADRRMYSLRDVTATVESIDLITSSIISKKIAEGTESLVLDIKTGRGAFMKNVKDALSLANAMISAGRENGLKVSAFITSMDYPLGYNIGNSLEVMEHISLLKNNIGKEGASKELFELVLTLGSEMLRLAGKVKSLKEGRKLLQEKIKNGEGIKKFYDIIKNQGGDPDVIKNPELLPLSKCCEIITAEKDGFISDMDPLIIGKAAVLLGAGRMRAEDPIDYGAGFKLFKRPQEFVKKSEPVAKAFAATKEQLKKGTEFFKTAIKITKKKKNIKNLIRYAILQ